MKVRAWAGGAEREVRFDEPAYAAGLGDNAELDVPVLRYEYTSLTTPKSVYDYDLATGARTLRKRDLVPGDFDPARYRTERLWAPARDGARVPISLVYRTDRRDGSPRPLLLYGYGSYGYSSEAAFRSDLLSLLDRGFTFAIAHIRGGQELGRRWYDQGRLRHKMNTFTDFIDCAEFLARGGHADRDQIYGYGGSAGGLLIGAVANLRPDLFRGLVAAVPFVDVVTTMLDDTIPLTTFEYEEWGNPNVKGDYEYMLAYSPLRQCAGGGLSALAGPRRSARFPGPILGTGQMGREAPGHVDRGQSGVVEDRSRGRPRWSVGPIQVAAGHGFGVHLPAGVGREKSVNDKGRGEGGNQLKDEVWDEAWGHAWRRLAEALWMGTFESGGEKQAIARPPTRSACKLATTVRMPPLCMRIPKRSAAYSWAPISRSNRSWRLYWRTRRASAGMSWGHWTRGDFTGITWKSGCPVLQREFPAPTGDPTGWSRTARIYHDYHHPEVYCPEPYELYPAHLHIDLLPRAQGRGWGRRMMDHLLAALRSKGSPGVHLGVGQINERAVGFYRKLGFEELARVRDVLYLGLRLK